MRPIVLIIIGILLLLLPVATAMYGGETETLYESNDCDQVFIELEESSSVVDDGEYSLHPCVLLYTNHWECNCTDDKIKIELTTLPNSINTYDFEINRSYYGELPDEETSTSSSSSSSSTSTSSSSSSSCVKDVKVQHQVTLECREVCEGYVSWYLRNGYKEGCDGEVEEVVENTTIKEDPVVPTDIKEEPKEPEEPESKGNGIPAIVWWGSGIVTLGVILYFVFKQ